MLVNPRKRRKASTKKRRVTRAKRRRNPGTSLAVNPRKRRGVRRYRRNPIGGNDIMSQLQNAAIGAGGALAVDVALAKLPIPANLKAGPALPAVKGAISIGLGMLVSKFAKKRALGKALAEGGLTVAMHDVAKPMVSRFIPGGLNGVDDSLMGYDLMGDEFDDVDAMDMSGYDDLSNVEDFAAEYDGSE